MGIDPQWVMVGVVVLVQLGAVVVTIFDNRRRIDVLRAEMHGEVKAAHVATDGAMQAAYQAQSTAREAHKRINGIPHPGRAGQ